MAPTIGQLKRRISIPWLWIIGAIVIGVIAAAAATYRIWSSPAQRFINDLVQGTSQLSSGAEADEDHDADHTHNEHDENAVELSEQAQKTIGLKIEKVQLTTFTRTVTVPGIVAERPGRSLFEVTAPLTGVVNKIFTIEGAAVESGQEMFEIRLTHEEVVQAQADMLRTVEELAVNQLEIERLEKVTATGLAGKTLLEREYEQRKLEGVLRAQRQALLLHGFSNEQVARIESNRALLQTFTVYAPQIPSMGESERKFVQLENLRVTQGQHVNAGDTLAVMTDHSELFVEGDAFERDADEVEQAAAESWSVTAYVQSEDEEPDIVDNLQILYVSSQINVDTRTLHFYVRLPNEKLRERTTAQGARFIVWRFRPGQRMQLQVPVGTWEDQIVLPVDAVAQEGPETYVFTADGDHFDRRPVHVLYRDATRVVIANDGAIFEGDMVVVSGAQQLQLALKTKASGGVDPHAGHSH